MIELSSCWALVQYNRQDAGWKLIETLYYKYYQEKTLETHPNLYMR